MLHGFNVRHLVQYRSIYDQNHAIAYRVIRHLYAKSGKTEVADKEYDEEQG